MKRILSVLLVASIVCTLLTGVAVAADEELTYKVPDIDNEVFLKYKLNANGNVIITGISETKAADGSVPTYDLVIPGTINENKVITIGKHAFFNSAIGSKMRSVKMPENVQNIDYGAFESCKQLQKVEILCDLKSTGRGMFYGCLSLTDVKFPDGLTTIEEGTFEYCSSLEAIDLPANVNRIGLYAFRGCKKLKSITIPNGVDSILGYTFAGCTELSEVNIPASVEYIGDNSFSGCSALTHIEIPDNVESINTKAFFNCPNLKTVTIPDSVTRIEEMAFGYIDGPDKLEGFTIKGGCNATAAKKYAEENGFTFQGDHNWNTEYTIDQPATCTTAGSKSIHCKTCGEAKDSTVIPATGHTEVTDTAVEATCTTAGKTEGKHCSVCNTIITKQEAIPALGHDFTGTYQTDETGHWHKCSRCAVTDSKGAHGYNTSNCNESANCTVCGYEKAAGQHIWGAGVVKKAATCTEAGETEYTCTACNEKKTETVAATGHTEVTDAAVEATCTTDGKTEGKHCSVCGEVLTAQTVIPAKGHKPAENWSSDAANHWHVCGVCNGKADAAAHTYSS